MRLNELTIKDAHEGLKKKQFSAVELTKAVLSEIKKKEKTIRAYITVTEQEALDGARKVDQLITDNQPLSPLSGIPVAVKDVISTQGVETSAGSKILEGYIPPYDATVVQKLREQNVVIIGKTNCDEFAMGSSTENSAYQKTKNPHDTTRVPGGSSGGSAAAVAAHECLLSLGSDTGGSIRQPAALCGVVGLKPTYGRVSRYGLIAMASSLDTIGPIAKTVEDAALALTLIAGHDPLDATTRNVPVPDYTKKLRDGIVGVRVGVPREYFGQGLNTDVRKMVERAIKQLEEQGAKVVEISLPYQEYALAVYYIIVPSEISANMARFDGVRYGKDRAHFGDEVKRRIMLGTYTLSSGYYDQYYNKAAKVRALIKRDFDEAFRKVDVIIGPTSPSVAWKFGEKTDNPLEMYLSDIYTITANLVGIPGISIPCGQVQGLPVGLQIMGPHFGEEKVLQIAYAYEQTTK